jgi:hypothetical protein
MSEQINKVLASTAQSFSEAEQAQARANIGAAAASAGGLASVYHDSNMTGSGTSASPMGLSSQVRFSNSTSATNIAPGALSATSHVATTWMGPGAFEVSNTVANKTAYMVGGSLTLSDSATSEKVDMSSIQRWNSYTQVSDGGDQYSPVYISGGSAIPVETARYVSTRIEGLLANSFTASAVDMIVPLGYMQGMPQGTEPCYVKYAGKLVTPYGVKLSLCCSGETLSTPTSVVSAWLDNAYIPAGGGYFNLNGITLGRGNNCNTKATWVSAHFDENPMNSPITIDDNIGWYMNISVNPVGIVPSI